MDIALSFVVVCFWTCIGLLAYSYAGYALLIWFASRFSSRELRPPAHSDDDLPTVTLILAAFNEESVLANRLQNALDLDYPADKLDIIVGSDGSTDRTAELARTFVGRRVHLVEFLENRGKASVLNDLATLASGEILLMSDANTRIQPSAVRHLVRWFRDPQVGVVVGRLILMDPESGRNVDGLYWKYETFLKRCEGRLGALLGANGAIYAIRRDLYEAIPADSIVDDFVVPLLAKRRTGCSIVYDPDATAIEETAPSIAEEFRRRARIGAGGFQSIGRIRGLLMPQHGWTAIALLSHKVLRWIGPFLLIGALAGNFLLWNVTPYRFCLAAQIVFYLLAFAVLVTPARWVIPRALRLPAMFVGMNAALLVGFWRWLRGTQKGTWERTARPGPGLKSTCLQRPDHS